MNTKISELLIYKGEQFRKIGLVGAVTLLCGVCLGIITMFCVIAGEYPPIALLVNPFGIFTFVLDALGAGLIPFYFFGLHYLGLGQIVRNTSSAGGNGILSDELPKL